MDTRLKTTTLTASYFAIALGAIMQVAAGEWDVIWHAHQNPETFFTPPHSLLYAGVILVLSVSIFSLSKQPNTPSNLSLALKLALIGAGLQIMSGMFDFLWHSNFGFDGLLSPPHSVLVSGMLLNGIATTFGILHLVRIMPRQTSFMKLAFPTAVGSLWMASVGMVLLFTLPLSEGEAFNFNPDPFAAAVTATIALPLITAAMVILGSRIPIKYPITALTALYVMANALATIIFHPGIEFAFFYYILTILVALAADLLLKSRLVSMIKIIIIGAMFGGLFYVIYFPLSTYLYLPIMGIPIDTDISALTLFKLTYDTLGYVIIVPSVIIGAVSALLTHKLIKKKLSFIVQI